MDPPKMNFFHLLSKPVLWEKESKKQRLFFMDFGTIEEMQKNSKT